VVEADAAGLERGGWRGEITPTMVLRQLGRHGQPNTACRSGAGDHDAAARFVERFLYQRPGTVATEHDAVVRLLQQVDEKVPV